MKLDLTIFGFERYDSTAWIRPDSEDDLLVEIIDIMPRSINAYRILDPDEEVSSTDCGYEHFFDPCGDREKFDMWIGVDILEHIVEYMKFKLLPFEGQLVKSSDNILREYKMIDAYAVCDNENLNSIDIYRDRSNDESDDPLILEISASSFK